MEITWPVRFSTVCHEATVMHQKRSKNINGAVR
jgi:hypothetical protein